MPSMAEFEQIASEVLQIHARAAAITMAALVERFLEEAIVSCLRRQDEKTVGSLVDTGGPLASFSSKIRLAYALRIIESPERDDLDWIREIRNVFAHAVRPITFSNPLVMDRVLKMNCAAGHSPRDLDRENAKSSIEEIDHIRSKFIDGCRKLSEQILTTAISLRPSLQKSAQPPT